MLASSCLYPRSSVCRLGTTRIPMTDFPWSFVCWWFFEDLSRMFKFGQNMASITGNTISKIFTSYTTINIKIHTIKCYKFLMATCFGRPCDNHQANFNRSSAFIGLTIWDPIMCTSFFIYGLKSLLNTQKKVHNMRIRDEIRFLYKKQHNRMASIKFITGNIYNKPTWRNLAVCLLVTAIMLYMFRTLFASILRST